MLDGDALPRGRSTPRTASRSIASSKMPQATYPTKKMPLDKLNPNVLPAVRRVLSSALPVPVTEKDFALDRLQAGESRSAYYNDVMVGAVAMWEVVEGGRGLCVAGPCWPPVGAAFSAPGLTHVFFCA